ncbi:uncharacterized protein FIBRA_01199 [Fibroporia radiculosa]|uniref:Uncharacterized protein n=1 Tax=Fibroporia radiculosa TaxID=599839 RepID=J4H0Z0_9APHY|nr:uncharacterized protein FIBRA_01199 [Fibroporia radiculosa]CCL99184.1 predicted protein [Fibroporia radiculosa]
MAHEGRRGDGHICMFGAAPSGQCALTRRGPPADPHGRVHCYCSRRQNSRREPIPTGVGDRRAPSIAYPDGDADTSIPPMTSRGVQPSKARRVFKRPQTRRDPASYQHPPPRYRAPGYLRQAPPRPAVPGRRCSVLDTPTAVSSCMSDVDRWNETARSVRIASWKPTDPGAHLPRSIGKLGHSDWHSHGRTPQRPSGTNGQPLLCTRERGFLRKANTTDVSTAAAAVPPPSASYPTAAPPTVDRLGGDGTRPTTARSVSREVRRGALWPRPRAWPGHSTAGRLEMRGRHEDGFASPSVCAHISRGGDHSDTLPFYAPPLLAAIVRACAS